MSVLDHRQAAKPECGLFKNLTYEEYSLIPALNFSTLKYMMRSPLSYRYNLDQPRKQSEEMKLGTICHTAMLEPAKTPPIAVWDQGRRYGKKWDAFCQQNIANLILTNEQYGYLFRIVGAVSGSPVAMKYLGAGRSEITMVWRDRTTGRYLKGRADKIVDGSKHVIADLKTCRDARPFRFGSEAYRLGYYLQLAMYCDGYFALTNQLPTMIEIAVENKPPHEVVVYKLPLDVLQQGSEDYLSLIAKLAMCEREDRWPPQYEEEEMLSLPSYAYHDPSDDLSDLELIAE